MTNSICHFWMKKLSAKRIFIHSIRGMISTTALMLRGSAAFIDLTNICFEAIMKIDWYSPKMFLLDLLVPLHCLVVQISIYQLNAKIDWKHYYQKIIEIYQAKTDETIDNSFFMTSVKKWKKQGPHTQSIYFCKEDSNIIRKPFKEFRCKSSKYQESFKLPRQENELFSHNHSVKEYQIAVKNTARHVKYKKKSDSEGETFFSKNTEVLSTVSEMS